MGKDEVVTFYEMVVHYLLEVMEGTVRQDSHSKVVP